MLIFGQDTTGSTKVFFVFKKAIGKHVVSQNPPGFVYKLQFINA